ncbi:MAG: hypothetical protein ABH845_02595 [Candidatus Omnitrophota bacterium]
MKQLWLRILREKWKTFARVIGNFNSRLILTLFYFLIVGIVSLLVGRWQNYLRKRPPTKTNWAPVTLRELDLPGARRQS